MSNVITLGANFEEYPTLLKASQDNSRIRIVTGPAGCLPAETEILTRSGWVSISTPVTEALTYDPATYTASFNAVEHIAYPETHFNRFHNHHAVDMVLSDEHRVWYQTHYAQKQYGDQAPWVIDSAATIAKKMSTAELDAKIPATFKFSDDAVYPLTDDELRLCVAISADGHLIRGGKVVVSLRKTRKIERLFKLLEATAIEYRATSYQSRKTEVVITFTPPEYSKDLSRFFGVVSPQQLKIMADELLLWDGTVHDNGAAYVSCDKGNIDFAQFAFVSTGVPSITSSYNDKRDESWSTVHRATYGINRKNAWVNLRTCKVERIASTDGMKYCLHTSTGMFIARHNGKIFATGNSAKTSVFGAVELLKIACLQEPSPVDNVRYTNFLVGRLTYQQLESSTIATFKRMLEPLFTFKTGSIPPKASADFQLPDGTRVKCLIEFLSFDSEDAQNKLLGFEPTAAFLDEISEMPESLIFAVNRRLGRAYTNGAPRTFTGLMAATNGPRKNHWLYEWDSGKRDAQFDLVSRETGRNFVRIFKQPSGLLKKPDGSWVPNPAAENIKNLEGGYSYYFSMLSDPWPKIQAYVLGEFADLVTGKLVFTEFNRDLHVVPEDKFTFRYGQGLLLAFDFGRTPVCIIGVASTSGRVTIIDEVVGEDMSIDTLCTDHLLPLLKAKYANSPIDGAWGDPAGMTENQATDLSPFDVLLKHGIPVMDPGSNKIAPRLEAVKQMLTKLDTQGKPKLQILDSCKLLINAIGSDYIYEMTRGAVVKDVPTKSHVNWVSDLSDSLQYMALGYTSSGLGRERRHLPKLARRFI